MKLEKAEGYDCFSHDRNLIEDGDSKRNRKLRLSLGSVFKSKSIGLADRLSVSCKNKNLRMIPKLWLTSGR